MKTKFVLSLLSSLLAAATPGAAADITFDTNVQGFQVEGATPGSFGWSSVNGGSMGLTNTAGWNGMVKLQLADYPALFTKLQTAQATGGNLEFDMIIRESDQVYTAGTNASVQLIVIANSAAGWLANDVGWTALPVSGSAQTNHIVLPIASSGTAEDGHFVVDISQNWANLGFGLNIGSAVSSGVVYIDNITFSANVSTNIQPVLWRDDNPAVSAVTGVDSALAVTPDQPDPAGVTNVVGVVYYTGSHPEYRNIGMQGAGSVSNAAYQLQKPLAGGYQWASINSNYYGGKFVFTCDVYVPTNSAIGTDTNDDITVFVRQTDASGGYNLTTDHFFQEVNLALRGQWQTVSVTNWISTTNPAIARVVANIGVHDDPTTAIPTGVAVFYLRNINFRLDPPAPPVAPPVLQSTPGGGNVTLNWTPTGFKLQAKTNSLTAGVWADYPSGATPPVVVPVDRANNSVFFRLVSQ